MTRIDAEILLNLAQTAGRDDTFFWAPTSLLWCGSSFCEGSFLLDAFSFDDGVDAVAGLVGEDLPLAAGPLDLNLVEG